MSAKTIKLQPKPEQDEFHGKISLEKLGEIWNDKETTYSEDELIKIRDWLYVITSVIYNTFKTEKAKVIELKQTEHEKTESDFVCEGEYRRAS